MGSSPGTGAGERRQRPSLCGTAPRPSREVVLSPPVLWSRQEDGKQPMALFRTPQPPVQMTPLRTSMPVRNPGTMQILAKAGNDGAVQLAAAESIPGAPRHAQHPAVWLHRDVLASCELQERSAKTLSSFL